MPALELREEAVPDRPDLTRLSLLGTLDIATLPQFEGALARLRQSGRLKVLVDLAKLEYISSSGLGAFLGTVDPFRQEGGDLAFIRSSERVKKIFKVVGFHRILTLKDTEAEAAEHFAPRAVVAKVERFLVMASLGQPHSGEAFDAELQASDARGLPVETFEGEVAMRPSLGIVSPAKAGPFVKGLWRGKVVLTGPGQVTLKVISDEASGEASFDVVETKAPAELPVQVSCPGCQLATEIRAFNVYRCKRCEEVYFVDKWAHAISLRPGAKATAEPERVIRVQMPADTSLLGPLRLYLVSALKECAYPIDMINDIELAADEAVTNIVEHAYQFDAHKVLVVEIGLERSQVRVTLKDTGTPFKPRASTVDLDQHIEERRTGGLGVYLMNKFMDSVDYKHVDGANVLTLIKKVPTV